MSVDSLSRDVLTARAVGQFPLSIPTSLAIESAIGILPEAPTDKPDINGRGLIMLNVRTLFRNLMGSVNADDKAKLTEYTIAETLANEMRTIETVISEHSDGRCLTQFYHCNYADLLSKFTRAIPKTVNTPGQKMYQAMEQASLKLLTTEFTSAAPVVQYKTEFQDTHASTLLVTHYAIDLLQRYKFPAMSLLESHTGAIKPPIMWNTKLHNGRELDIIPFDRMTLQLFGDGVTFTPMAIKIRKRVYNIAVKNKWTPATTKDYVIHCIEENHDPALEVLVKDLYRR